MMVFCLKFEFEVLISMCNVYFLIYFFLINLKVSTFSTDSFDIVSRAIDTPE